MINLHALVCANLTSAALLALGFLFNSWPLATVGGIWYALSAIFCLASFTVYKDTIQQNDKRLNQSISDIVATATETMDDIAAGAKDWSN